MMEKEALLTLPEGFSELEPQFNYLFKRLKDKVRGSPKTTKAALFYILALIRQKRVTMAKAGSVFGVTAASVGVKKNQVIDAMKKEKILNL